jgi:outer membrane protein
MQKFWITLKTQTPKPKHQRITKLPNPNAGDLVSWSARFLLGWVFWIWAFPCAAATNNGLAWGDKALSLSDAINIALEKNYSIRKGRHDLEAAHGIAVQTRAIVWPKLRANGDYLATDQTEDFPTPPGFPDINFDNDQRWSATLRLVQSIYEGGRITSGLRTARLTREQALLQHQAVIAEALLQVRTSYYDVLLGQQQISVEEASVALLEKELQDTRRRYEAGTVPQFNVLRAEVELANAQPRLIRARNTYRIAKNTLLHQLGQQIPTNVWENIPLELSDRLEPERLEVDLSSALARAVVQRPEIGALEKAEELRKEEMKSAKGGYKPSVQVFAGYGSRSSQFSDDLSRDVSGWHAGAQVSWDIFDGWLTKGKVRQARALHERARTEVEDTTRQIEFEVRTAHSSFIEAREVLESQRKVQEQAQESLRLANSRADAGTGTQLDVLNAQTALTAARTTQIQALRDYLVARARLLRAMGAEMPGQK